jgi:hypothetical protein
MMYHGILVMPSSQSLVLDSHSQRYMAVEEEDIIVAIKRDLTYYSKYERVFFLCGIGNHITGQLFSSTGRWLKVDLAIHLYRCTMDSPGLGTPIKANGENRRCVLKLSEGRRAHACSLTNQSSIQKRPATLRISHIHGRPMAALYAVDQLLIAKHSQGTG